MFSIGPDGNLDLNFEPLLPLCTNVKGLNAISRIPYCWGIWKGVTWAAVHNMAGLVEHLAPGSSILYIVPTHEWTYHIARYASTIFEDHGIEGMYDGINKTISVGSTRVYFVSTNIYRIVGFAGYRVFDSGEARYYSYLNATEGAKYRLARFWHRAQTIPTMRFRYYVIQDSRVHGGQIIRSEPIA